MIYLDYAATTPVDKRVLRAMMPYFTDVYGNASSKHEAGDQARSAVEESRKRIAKQINASPDEIIFTAGACEANNLCVKGYAENLDEPAHFITSSIEHKSMIEAMNDIAQWGHEVTFIDPDEYGIIDPQDVADALRDDTVLCSIMHVNNEIGTIQPIHEIADACHEQGVIFHTDATQSFGKMPLNIDQGLDMISASAHKIYGPKGIGFLYCSKDVPLKCQIAGGSQENGLRAGTLNVPGIVGFYEATKIACGSLEKEYKRMQGLEEALYHCVLGSIPLAYIQGDEDSKVPWINNICFFGVDGAKLRDALSKEGYCVSRSSACAKSGSASHVLEAIGTRQELSPGAIRISFGRETTKKDVEKFCDTLAHYVNELRK